MTGRKTVTVSITAEQDAFVRDRVRSGRFGSVSEVVRAGLRLLERDEVGSTQEPRLTTNNRSSQQKGQAMGS